MKTVWIINHYAQVPKRAGGTRHYQLAKALPKYGWKACILAASTDCNTGRQRFSQKEKYRLNLFDDIPFLFLRAPAYQGNGISRIINMIVFSLRLLISKPDRLLPRPDVIIGSSVHPFAVWSAYRLARKYRVPFIFEVRDLWPQTLIDFGLFGDKSLVARLLRILEGYLYRRSSAIITLLPFAFQYIKRFKVNSSDIHWIPNGVDLSIWPMSPPPLPKSSLQLMYFGSFGRANALDTMLDAMHEIENRYIGLNVHLRLIGEGPLKQKLTEKASCLGLKNVTFEKSVPKEKIPFLAAEADLFLVNLVDSPLYKYGISLNKLYDYMAACRPIIIGSSAANNPIFDAGAGMTVPPSDPVALADAILFMARLQPNQRHKLGMAGRAYVEKNNDSRLLSRKLAQVLQSVVSKIDINT